MQRGAVFPTDATLHCFRVTGALPVHVSHSLALCRTPAPPNFDMWFCQCISRATSRRHVMLLPRLSCAGPPATPPRPQTLRKAMLQQQCAVKPSMADKRMHMNRAGSPRGRHSRCPASQCTRMQQRVPTRPNDPMPTLLASQLNSSSSLLMGRARLRPCPGAACSSAAAAAAIPTACQLALL
jgi:hypothetical protein